MVSNYEMYFGIAAAFIVLVSGASAVRAFHMGGPNTARRVRSSLVSGLIYISMLGAGYLWYRGMIFAIDMANEAVMNPGEAPSKSPVASTATPETPPAGRGTAVGNSTVWRFFGAAAVAFIVLAGGSTLVAQVARRRWSRGKEAAVALNKIFTAASDIREKLDGEYAAFEMSLEDVVLNRPLLADTSEPLTAKFHREYAVMQDAFVRVNRRDIDTVQAALDAARSAREAWDAASKNAINHGVVGFDARKIKRIRALLKRASHKDTPGPERDTAIDMAASILAEVRKTPQIIERGTIATHLVLIEDRRAIDSTGRRAIASAVEKHLKTKDLNHA